MKFTWFFDHINILSDFIFNGFQFFGSLNFFFTQWALLILSLFFCFFHFVVLFTSLLYFFIRQFRLILIFFFGLFFLLFFFRRQTLVRVPILTFRFTFVQHFIAIELDPLALICIRVIDTTFFLQLSQLFGLIFGFALLGLGILPFFRGRLLLRGLGFIPRILLILRLIFRIGIGFTL